MGGTCSCLGLEAALAALSDDVGYSSPGGRPVSKSPWYCAFGSKYCKRSRCCVRCVEVLPPDSPAVRGYHANTRNRKQNHRDNAAQAPPPGSFAFHSDTVDETDAALEAAAQVGMAAIQHDVLNYQDGSNKPCMVNVFLASTGTLGNSIVEEGNRSTLSGRGYSDPRLVVDRPSLRTCVQGGDKVEVWYTILRKSLCEQLGPPAVTFYDAHDSKHACKVVEKKTQLIVEAGARDLNIEVAWKVAGQGGAKGSPPCKVGYRIFEMNHDGTFPRGVVRYEDGPAEA